MAMGICFGSVLLAHLFMCVSSLIFLGSLSIVASLAAWSWFRWRPCSLGQLAVLALETVLGGYPVVVLAFGLLSIFGMLRTWLLRLVIIRVCGLMGPSHGCF